MSRIRATTAPSEVDRAIAQRVERATRELEDAARLARGSRGDYRAKRVERDLSRIIGSLRSVGTISPRSGDNDPDQVSEDERNRLARERRAQERAEAAARVAEVTSG